MRGWGPGARPPPRMTNEGSLHRELDVVLRLLEGSLDVGSAQDLGDSGAHGVAALVVVDAGVVARHLGGELQLGERLHQTGYQGHADLPHHLELPFKFSLVR